MKKKVLTIVTVLLLVVALTAGLSACKKDGKGKFVFTSSQIDALKEVKAGTSDIAILDNILASTYLTKGDFNDIGVIDCIEAPGEEYGIAVRKGEVALKNFIWNSIVDLNSKDKQVETLAKKYGLEDYLIVSDDKFETPIPSGDDSLDKIKKAKKVTIGYTIFEPMNYEDENGLTGFDTELARMVFGTLEGVEVDFMLIEWEKKEIEIKGGAIDVIWNGMTIDEERKKEFEMTPGYLVNKQVAVAKKEKIGKFSTLEGFLGASFAAEAGSAGESMIKGVFEMELKGQSAEKAEIKPAS